MGIPLVLWHFARRRRDLPFKWVFGLFGAFIIACGTTHLLEALAFSAPLYRLAGAVKLLTAVVSVITAIVLVPLVPRLLALRSPEELEREVAERCRTEDELRREAGHLRLIKSAAVTANEAANLDEAVRDCLRHICACTGWPVGHSYLVAGDSLVPSAIWHFGDTDRFSALKLRTESGPVCAGIGLPGRVLATRGPVWIGDLENDPGFLRKEEAKAGGLRAGVAVPVMIGATVAAVLEFFSAEVLEHDEQLLASLETVGVQLGRVVERERAALELAGSEQALLLQTATLQSIIESMGEGVAVADSQGKLRTGQKISVSRWGKAV